MKPDELEHIEREWINTFRDLPNSLQWHEVEIEDGLGFETKHGNYRGRVETCNVSQDNALRNRKWSVWYERNEPSVKANGLVATGYCYGTQKAEMMVTLAILLNL